MERSHPFVDGNGRSARVAMNNELVAAGQYRIIVPTISRLDYLSTLTRATNGGGADGLYRILDHNQQWVSRGDWSTLPAGLSYVQDTNALVDARDAEQRRVYLEVPEWTAMQGSRRAASPAGSSGPQPRGQLGQWVTTVHRHPGGSAI